MTSEIKPEDVKLPEPMRIIVGIEGCQFQTLDVLIFTADQVRAAVLAERERCAALCEAVASSDMGNDEWDAGQIAGAEKCAAAIRAGHSITETPLGEG